MTRPEKQAMLAKQESIKNAVEFLKKRPGFAHAQAQAMRMGKEWRDGLSEQEKRLASPQRLEAVLRLIDIRAEPYLSLVDDMESQEAFMAMANGITDQAWEDYVGLSVYQAPPFPDDPNYKSITDRGWHWVTQGYERVDAKEKELSQQPAAQVVKTAGKPLVFISYSWDDEAHKQWVLNLANRLRDDGIDAIIDQTHLDLGGDTPEFMEKSIRDSRYVLVVCTEKYKDRFDGRSGGTGYEGHIITAQMLKKVEANKFIPLLRRGNWDDAMPTALEGRFGADLSRDSEDEYRKLVKHLHGAKSIRPVGSRPAWLDESTTASGQTAEPSSEEGYLAPDDITLMHRKSNFSLDIWLKNHTLAPMDGCRLKLTNLQKFSERHKEFRKNPFTAMEMIRAQTIIADGTTNEAVPLAGFQNTNKKTLLIFRTFPFESACILMAEFLIEGGGCGRTEAKFISWEPGGDPEFIDDPRLAKPAAPTNPPFIVPAEYAEERKTLPDSDIVRKIWAMPRWCICCRPEEFKKARFRDLDHCVQFVASAQVCSRGWDKYPCYSTSPEEGDKWIAGECEMSDTSKKHLERWVLFRSGQFVHNLALDQMPALDTRTHVLEILNTTTALFDFISRMADSKIISGRAAISFDFYKVEGRQLTWPKDASQMDDFVDKRTSWCQLEAFAIDNTYSSTELIDRRRELALQAALMIYSKFGWNDPPVEELRKMQREKFGLPIPVNK